MSTEPQIPITEVLAFTEDSWEDGPPNELFARMRSECPVHWSPEMPDFPEEAGYWSVTTYDDIHDVSRDWETYSSEIGGITAITDSVLPLELSQAMFIGMDPPKHDRLKALFQRGFTPKRIAEHGEESAPSPATCSTGSMGWRSVTSLTPSPSRSSRG
ncbi:MAG: hypothetical protein ACKOTH_07985 [Solirubrobacterales bacterium]